MVACMLGRGICRFLQKDASVSCLSAGETACQPVHEHGEGSVLPLALGAVERDGVCLVALPCLCVGPERLCAVVQLQDVAAPLLGKLQ